MAKNYLYNLLYQALNIALPMITLPYVTRIILPAQMGLFSTAQAFFTIVALAAAFGVTVYGTRAIAIAQKEKDLLLDQFRRIFCTQVMTALLFFVVSAALPLLLLERPAGLIYATSAGLVLNAALDTSWYYNGLEEFKTTVTRNIFVKLLAVALIFLLVKKESDIVLYTAIYVVSALFGNLAMIYSLPKFAGTRKVFSFRWVDIKVVREAFPFLASLLLSQISAEFGRFFVYGLAGEAVTGIYDQALKTVRMLIILTTALVTVAGPRMAKFAGGKSYKQMRSYFARIFLFLTAQSALMAVGVLVVGEDFVSFFFGPAYGAVAPVLRALSLYPLVFMLEQSVLVLLLRPLGKTRVMLASVLVSLGVDAAFNLLLIPSLGAAGAGISMILASLANSAVQVMGCRRFLLLRPIFKAVRGVFLAAAVTVLLLLFIKSRLCFSAIVNFLAYGTASVALYGGMILLFSKEIRAGALGYISKFLRLGPQK